MTAVAIFAKTAALSPVKTRLAAAIGPDTATVFHRLSAWACGSVVTACAPLLHGYWAVAEQDGLGHTDWQGHPTLWQGEGGLGRKLHTIYAALQERHGRVLLLGCDAPQISPAKLLAAARALETGPHPFVMGRAEDGGFWLFGGRLPIPAEVWMTVPYSQPDTAERLLAALVPIGGTGFLPTLRDVDEAGDLAPLATALAALPQPLPEQVRLRAWIEALPRQAGVTYLEDQAS
ncbi:DUF2064 domain-containing protein [Teichococcus aestuarii]|uniref:Glycosyltransferase n=1 Tax=Teichococcus aestuarii TaxID=568898 RepID=A0A2U1UY12_9PROT|nr:DUF2064 domain-containing protein [Pseudoroseomonas aestuarii]PWC26546.1 hypothetical protein CR165_22580 [Pseudoroseomonas aestuarii]